MVKILVPEETNRLSYTFHLLLTEILSIDFVTTTDVEEYFTHDGPRFTYGYEKVEDELYIESSSILFESGIRNFTPQVTDWEGLPIFFASSEHSSSPFDLFAASFYLVSRYEEYFPAKADHHGRFRSKTSLASKHGFLKRPLVNLYAQVLKGHLEEHFPSLVFPDQQANVRVTIDIDNAYAFRHKGLGRTLGALGKKLVKFKFGEFGTQVACILGLKSDPYDSYDKQFLLQQKYNLRPVYFFLMADYGKHDRNLSHRNRQFQKLIRSVGQSATVGIHPSYASLEDVEKIGVEKKRLEDITGSQITRSRHHYIRLRVPESYRHLIDQGIQEDYSMGYPCRVGFRASICTPFHFYDLENEEVTGLRVFPFFAMDTTLKKYERVRSKDALSFLKPLVEEIKQVNGDICFILHNESIGGQGMWKRWGNFYEDMVQLSIRN